MIHGAEYAVGVAHRALVGKHVLQGHRAGAFMQKHAINGQQALSTAKIAHFVQIPQFFKQSLAHAVSVLPGQMIQLRGWVPSIGNVLYIYHFARTHLLEVSQYLQAPPRRTLA